MYISKISYTNNSNSISPNNLKDKNKINYSAMGMSKPSKTDSVSFGAMSVIVAGLLQEVAEGAAKGLFGIVKVHSAIAKANGLFTNDSIETGIETAIQLSNKIGEKLSTSCFSDFDELLSNAVTYASKLSDKEYANKDLKQRLIWSIFMNNNRAPNSAHKFFHDMDNKIYGDFKENLIKKMAYSDNPFCPNSFEYLMEGVGNPKFREETLAHVKCIDEERTEKFNDQMRDADVTIMMGGRV